MASMVRMFLVAAAILGGTIFPSAAQPAAKKELSDGSVRVLMDYAWSILPSKFTMPDGRVIEVDKTNKMKETVVPLDIAREVIKVGYFSAQAQLCEMWEEQTLNYDAMIRIQRAKHGWSDQQLLYITTLHRMTIHMAAGKLKVTEKAGEQIVTLDPIEPSKDTCNDEKRKTVKEVIAANVETAKAVSPPSRKADSGTTSAPKDVMPASQKQ